MSSPDVPPPDQITKDVSVQSFVSAIVLTGAVALVYTGAFTILRKRFPLVYAPRTFLVPERYLSHCIRLSYSHRSESVSS